MKSHHHWARNLTIICCVSMFHRQTKHGTKVFNEGLWSIVLDSRRKRKILHTSTPRKSGNTEWYVREGGKRTYHCSDAGNGTRHFNDAENETRKATRQNKSWSKQTDLRSRICIWREIKVWKIQNTDMWGYVTNTISRKKWSYMAFVYSKSWSLHSLLI